MTEVELTMKLSPRGKGRPRFSRRGHAYVSPLDAHYERCVSALLRAHLGPMEPMSCGVEVSLKFYFPAPKRPAHPFPSSFDLDNLEKGVLDAANKIVWADDNLVRRITSEKLYGEPARIEFHARAAE